MRLGDREPNPRGKTADEMSREALMKHLAPVPRLEIGRALGERGIAAAMIDVSDGLSTDLSHILDESGVGAVIHASAIPVALCVESLAACSPAIDALQLALHGGEEYELLFTCRSDCKAQLDELSGDLSLSLSRIGEIVTGNGLQLERNGALEPIRPAGYEHAI
jgi:thiamine-monophosphate kinase